MDATSPPPRSASAAPRPAWALVVSGLFHPLLVPTYIYVFLASVNPFLFGANELSEPRALQTLLMIFLYTFVIPLISILLMRALEMVGSVMMEDRMERIGPLLLVMVVYFWVYYNFSSNGMPPVFLAFLFGTVLALAVAFVINVMDKISLHAVGMGGLATMLVVSAIYFGDEGITLGSVTVHLGLVAVLGLVLTGVVGTARLVLGAHVPSQVYAGYLVGMMCQLGALLFYF